MLGRGQENALEFRVDRPVHVGELKLVLEVGHGAQAAQHAARIATLGKVGQEVGKPQHLDIFKVSKGRGAEAHPLIDIEQRRLLFAKSDRHHNAVKQARGALRQIDMAVGDRIEGARVDDGPVIHGKPMRSDDGGW